MAEKKVYDYNPEKVKKTVLRGLKTRNRESTIADIVSETGLPNYQASQTLKEIMDEYQGHMKVTSSGEILYYFPRGFKSRYRGTGAFLRGVFRRILYVTGRVLTYLFKIWIMVMLVGYFVLFVALLLLAFVASIAVSAGSKGGGRSRGRGGFGSFYLTTLVFDFFMRLLLYSSLTKSRKKQEKKRPLHVSVFAFVFGSGNPNWDIDNRETQEVISYIQSHKGIITMDELRTLTGRDLEETQQYMNRLCLRHNGEPRVGSMGSLYFEFPSLMLTSSAPARPRGIEGVQQSLIPFNDNKSSTNKWITFFNAVNLAFGLYFFSYSFLVNQIQAGDGFSLLYLFTGRLLLNITDNPVPFLGIGLGVVPLLFAFFFYAIPLLRRIKEHKENRKIQEKNFRQKIYKKIIQNPEEVIVRDILPSGRHEAPGNWESFRVKTIETLGAERNGEVTSSGEKLVYSFPEIAEETVEIAEIRSAVDISEYSLGKTVFDSGR